LKCSLLLKAWVLLFIGTMLFNLGYCCILLMISFRATSSNSPRHPSASGRRRRIHHIIPTSPDDVVEFTTSSQCFRTTSSNSPHHPNVSGRRRRIHHVIPTSPGDVVKFTTSSQPTPSPLSLSNQPFYQYTAAEYKKHP
jgi:hypothetical protein